MLFREAVRKLREAIYLSKGRFRSLIYLNYIKLVRKLKRKRILETDNPLPMELCSILSEYAAEKIQSKNEKNDLSGEQQGIVGESLSEVSYKKAYSQYEKVFQYIEKVLYSSYETNETEYKDITGHFWNHPVYVVR